MAILFIKADAKVGSLAPHWYDRALSGAAMLSVAIMLTTAACGIARRYAGLARC